MRGVTARWRAAAGAVCCASHLGLRAAAATLELAGPRTEFEPVGIDADAVVREVPWAFVNAADTDSRYAPLPDWSQWRTVGDGLLEIRATVEGGASNAVWFAFGPEDAPALRIGWECGRWHVLGGDGAVAALGTVPGPPAASGARSILVSLRTGATLAEGRTEATVRESEGAWQRVPSLDLDRLGWADESQHPAAWDAARLSLRGEGAAVAELTLRWNTDRTLILVR
jgi:hypothetical protein